MFYYSTRFVKTFVAVIVVEQKIRELTSRWENEMKKASVTCFDLVVLVVVVVV